MTDLERAVINAARELYESWDREDNKCLSDAEIDLERALDVLDDSLKPDPWQLLEAAIFDWKNMNKVTGSTIDAMLKALEWRRTND